MNNDFKPENSIITSNNTPETTPDITPIISIVTTGVVFRDALQSMQQLVHKYHFYSGKNYLFLLFCYIEFFFIIFILF